MTGNPTVTTEALSQQIESVTERLDTIEQRLGRIENALAKLAQPLANLSTSPTTLFGGQPAKACFPAAPRKRSPDRSATKDDTPSRESYQYQPLEPSRNEIRILHLIPSSEKSDPLRGHFLHINLDDPEAIPPVKAAFTFGVSRPLHSYNALSYTCANESAVMEQKNPIFIADAQILVTDNLSHALRQLRSNHKNVQESSYWWIDAICINQKDVEERNSQVALMRRIYGRARHVTVWLGKESEGSTEAIKLIKALAHPPQHGPAHPEMVYPTVSDDEKLDNLARILAIFRRSWWDRVWVRQEVALGHQLTFLCGDASCNLEELVDAEKALESILSRLQIDPSQPNALHIMNNVGTKEYGRAEGLMELRRISNRGETYVNLCTLLFHARTCKSTDRRDKVFGVLGLADTKIYGLAVDYQLKYRDVYLKAATAIISKTKRLDILSAAQNIDRAHSLPSWAPNLIEGWKAQPFPIETFPTTAFSFQSRHPLASEPARWGLSPSGKVLTVKGRVYGYLHCLGDQGPQVTHHSHELHRIFSAWTDFAVSKTQPKANSGLFGNLNFGSTSKIYHPPGGSHVMQLLDVELHTFNFQAQSKTDDTYDTYYKSLLAPEAWIVCEISDLSIQRSMRKYGVGRRIASCWDGQVGLVPANSQEGDVVVSLYGATNLYILRRKKDRYLLVGDASFPKHTPFTQKETKLTVNDEDFAIY